MLGWQVCCGMRGNVAVESAASLLWNQWQVWRGISGKFHMELVATFARNTHGPPHPRNYGHLCECNGRRATSHRGPHVVLSAEVSLTESAASSWAYGRAAALRSASCGAFAVRPRVFLQARPGDAGVACGDHPCPLEAL